MNPHTPATLARFARRGLPPLLALCGVASAGRAQTTPPPFEDTIAQRVQACTGCHGKDGRAARDGYYPRIAGKPAGYLYNQLLNFRDGRRHYSLMTAMVDPLSDAYLREIAEYFAGLDLPYPPPARSTPPALLEKGRRLVMDGDPARRIPACVQCHGAAMTGVVPAIPGLLGLPRDYLNAQLGAWKNGNRRALSPDCMAQVGERMTDEDIGAVSLWLAAQPVPGQGKPAASLPAPLPLHCGSVPDAAVAAGAPR